MSDTLIIGEILENTVKQKVQKYKLLIIYLTIRKYHGYHFHICPSCHFSR